MPIPKRKLNRSMKLICDFFKNEPKNKTITHKYLSDHGIANEEESRHIVAILKSLGYLKLGAYGNREGIILTESGKCYFEKKREQNIDRFLKIAPIWISIIALLKSFQCEILSIWKLLTQ